MQADISESAMAALERFVVLLYDRTSGILNVNESRNISLHTEGQELGELVTNFSSTQAAHETSHLSIQLME